MKTENIRINGGKGFLLALGNAALVGSYNGSNDRIFVDISTTADGVGNFHHKSHYPFYKKDSNIDCHPVTK